MSCQTTKPQTRRKSAWHVPLDTEMGLEIAALLKLAFWRSGQLAQFGGQRPAKGRNKQALRLRSPRGSRQMALVFGVDSRFDKFVAALPFQVLNCFTGDRGDYPRRPSTTVFSCLQQPHTKQAVRSQLGIFSRQICRRPFVVHPPPTLPFAPWFERKPPKVKPQLCGVPLFCHNHRLPLRLS